MLPSVSYIFSWMDPVFLLLLLPLFLARGSDDDGPVYSEGYGKFPSGRYSPGSAEQIDLFRKAAKYIGAPEGWASSPSFISLLASESGGRVGIPNFTYGQRAKDSSRWPEVWSEIQNGVDSTSSDATGLGQLKGYNVDKFYPDGRMGIGDAWNEAVGMLKYIKKRWGTPQRAWECYEAYACMSGKGVFGDSGKTWRGY